MFLWKRREDLLESTGKVSIENILYFQNLGIEVHLMMAIMEWHFKLLIFKKTP